eukprot:1502152-Prymnesium_polylepis.1
MTGEPPPGTMTFLGMTIGVALAAVATVPECPPHATVPECDGWALVFNDEFDDSLGRWSQDIGNGADATSQCVSACCPGKGWGNGERQEYTTHSATVRAGMLNITAEHSLARTYTSARLVSKAAFTSGAE